MGWAIKWRSNTLMEGKREHLMGDWRFDRPQHFSGYTKMVFRTRREAREFIAEQYSYIKERPDLRQEHHGRRMPVPGAARVKVQEV